MSILGEQVLLRVYLRSADRAPHAPTFQRIVHAARRHRLSGATVLRGILGAGHHGILAPTAWSLLEHAPVIVEIVDAGARIADFVRGPLDQVMTGGMATIERAVVMMYRDRRHDPPLALRLAGALKPLSTLPQIQPGAHMSVNDNGVLLRVFIGESDRFEGRPLFEAIVHKVRELGLAGATVLRGTEGFGAHSVVHKASLLEMSTDLPIVVEIVDTDDNVRRLLPHLETMVQEGMITMEYVVVLTYRHGPPEMPPAVT
jgi:PII-like signaling protein